MLPALHRRTTAAGAPRGVPGVLVGGLGPPDRVALADPPGALGSVDATADARRGCTRRLPLSEQRAGLGHGCARVGGAHPPMSIL